MNIGFDAKRLFNNFTGLGNYSRFVINALATHHPENNYWLYSPTIKDHPETQQLLSQPSLKTVTPQGAYSFIKSIWRSWGISQEASMKDLDVFHGLSQELPLGLPGGVKKVVTVHDLIFLRWPKFYNPIDVAIYTRKVRSACRSADKILAISQQTADDIVNLLKIDSKKIEIHYQGCHPNFKKKYSVEDLKSVSDKYKLPPEYILNVGTIEERKNVLLLVKAVALLPKELRIPVVIVGRATAYMDNVATFSKEAGISEWVIFLHHVSFEDLPAIYQGAKVFVYPSLFEGFGIPIVEALEVGVPVIATTGSCLEEAGGPGSIYVGPSNEQELVYHLKKVLVDDELRKQMITAGKRHISRFEPNIISDKLTGIYTSLIN